MTGFVYVLFNPSMPNLLKVGQTSKNPYERMQQLSSATACPTPFEMLAYFECEDPKKMENFVHNELRDLRVNQLREFFKARRVDVLEAISTAFDHLEMKEISWFAPWPLKEGDFEYGPN